MAKKTTVKVKKPIEMLVPVEIQASSSDSGGARTRRNASSVIVRSDRFANIEDGLIPYSSDGKGGNFNIREAIILCQKCYYNFSIFKNVIELMVDFSVNEIKLKGGNKATRDFFTAYFEKINLWNLENRFFREFYRSGNVFLHKMMAKVDEQFKNNITKIFGGKYSSAKTSYKIPLEYIILNPAEIETMGSISFDFSNYYKTLNSYEIQRLKLRTTPEEKLIYDGLDAETKKLINERGNISISIKLKPEETCVIFYAKQDYEPFAVPMGYPVLEDISYKAELKKMDMALTRTMQQMVLLITIGYESKDGDYRVNQAQIEALQNLFANQSIGRVLVADFTTKAEFVVPKIADILDPKKYEIVNQDIKEGLNYVLAGDNEKFANKSMNIKVFIQRLKQARQSFINDFLLPEIKSIAKALNFKNYPTPYFEDIDFKDELEYYKVFTRAYEVGLFTAEDTLEAMESGKIPDIETSLEKQKEFKKCKDDGCYQPITGGPANQMEVLDKTNKNAIKLQESQQIHDDKQNTKQRKHDADNPPPKPPPSIQIVAPLKQPKGRPSGSKVKQKSKKVTPVGGSVEEFEEEIPQLYSTSKLVENMKSASDLIIKVLKAMEKKYKVKKLTNEQVELGKDVAKIVIANENPESWESTIEEYLENPVDKNTDRISEIQDIAYEHQIDTYLASLLYISKTEE